MKILHSSDWHIGRRLFGRKRYEEYEAFLNWIIQIIESENIDTLLVSGDVFDTVSPSNRAQEIYYSFLYNIAKSKCKNIIITAGNHDSASFLSAPKALLKTMNIHIIAEAGENPEDEIIILRNEKKIAEAIICAVPYLRDKDIRISSAGESTEEKNLKLMDGIKKHYEKVCNLAENKQSEFKKDNLLVPIIAMGHLFTAGGKTNDGDGVRELYVGSLAHIHAENFPKCIDYLALGHLHQAQKVNSNEKIRYSGSPISMSFSESKNKKVISIDFSSDDMKIEEINVPCFQKLERISGNFTEIKDRINAIKEAKENIWLEIEYTGKEIKSNLKNDIEELIVESKIEIIRIQNRQVVDSIINKKSESETLEEISELDVFQRLLDKQGLNGKEKDSMMHAYQEILTNLHETDINAE